MAPLGASFVATPRAASGTAPGKLILLGEHAVVFGEPALALPFGAVGATARVEPAYAAEPAEAPHLWLRSDAYSGPLVEAIAGASAPALPAVATGLGAAARCVLDALGWPEAALTIHLDSTIPLARGLGSSAAVAVALARALYAAHGAEPSPAQLLDAVARAEACAHGKASGVDAAAVCAAGPVFFRMGRPVEAVAPGAPFHLVVADSGVRRDTRSAVSAVQAQLADAPERTRERLADLGRFATEGGAALEAGDAAGLGALLDAAQRELVALGVSHPVLDGLVTAARGAGALGAKLTGAGRGGCVVALAPDAEGQAALAEAWRGAGAAAVWSWSL